MGAEWWDKRDPDDFSPRPLLEDERPRNDPEWQGYDPNEDGEIG